MHVSRLLAIAALSYGLAAPSQDPVPGALPPAATTQLAESLEAAKPQPQHVWRDTPPINAGSAAEERAHVDATHIFFFFKCRDHAGRACTPAPSR